MSKFASAATLFCLSMILLVAPAKSGRGTMQVDSSAPEHHIRLYHTHTGERIDIIYRRGDLYVPEAEEELDHFLCSSPRRNRE